MKNTTFLNMVEDLIVYDRYSSVDNIDHIMDLIYDHIDTKLLSGDFSGVDWIISNVRTFNTPIVLLLSYLTITLAAKNRLQNRKDFFKECYDKVKDEEGKDKADRLFQGLE